MYSEARFPPWMAFLRAKRKQKFSDVISRRKSSPQKSRKCSNILRRNFASRKEIRLGENGLDGASVALSSQQGPFRDISESTLHRKSWVFSGYPSFLPQGMLTGWVVIARYWDYLLTDPSTVAVLRDQTPVTRWLPEAPNLKTFNSKRFELRKTT